MKAEDVLLLIGLLLLAFVAGGLLADRWDEREDARRRNGR